MAKAIEIRPLEGVREGFLHGEPQPMLLPVAAIESAHENPSRVQRPARHA